MKIRRLDLLAFVFTALTLFASRSSQATPFTLGTTFLYQGPASGSNSVVLGVNPASIPWTATNNGVSWLHLSAASQSGIGSTNVVFSYDSNPGATRSAALTIAGQPLFITQAGSTYVQTPSTLTTLVSSNLSNVNGVAVDTSGNVYFSDSGDNTVKKWVVASNIVVTLVSNNLSSPSAVAVDTSGNVYIADSGHN